MNVNPAATGFHGQDDRRPIALGIDTNRIALLGFSSGGKGSWTRKAGALLPSSGQLKMPTVMVYGVKDTFLPPPDGSMISSLNEGRTTFRAMALDDVRHFPMLEEKADFTRLMLAFLETPDVHQIDLKEVWVRRVR